MSKIRKFKVLFYITIPIIMVLACRVLEAAQGEQNEEIVFGIIIGIFMDVVFAIVLSAIERFRLKTGRKT